MKRTTITLAPTRRGLHDLTATLTGWIAEQDVEIGLLHVFLQHTSASLLIQENADPDVLHDLETWFASHVPDGDPVYRHRDEGPDDMPSHIRAALTQPSLTIPVHDGRLALGTWQGVYLFEHRLAPHTRRLILTLLDS